LWAFCHLVIAQEAEAHDVGGVADVAAARGALDHAGVVEEADRGSARGQPSPSHIRARGEVRAVSVLSPDVPPVVRSGEDRLVAW
jgi:hypothetical protein